MLIIEKNNNSYFFTYLQATVRVPPFQEHCIHEDEGIMFLQKKRRGPIAGVPEDKTRLNLRVCSFGYFLLLLRHTKYESRP